MKLIKGAVPTLFTWNEFKTPTRKTPACRQPIKEEFPAEMLWSESDCGLKGSLTGQCVVTDCKNREYGLEKWMKKECETHNGCNHNTGISICVCAPPYVLWPFPTEQKDSHQRNEWIRLVNRKGFEITSKSRICSKHFPAGRPTLAEPNPTIDLGYKISILPQVPVPGPTITLYPDNNDDTSGILKPPVDHDSYCSNTSDSHGCTDLQQQAETEPAEMHADISAGFASPSVVTEQKVGHITGLPELILGTLSLRTIYYSGAGSVSLKDKPGLRTLFLAADILPSKKYSNVHAKYCKLGYAIKLQFENFKVEGITNIASGLWFYSVQGLFKAAFEHGDTSMQRACVKYLQSSWLEDFELQPLVNSESVMLDLTHVVTGSVDQESRVSPLSLGIPCATHPSVSVQSVDDPVSSLLRNLCHSVRAKINHTEPHAHAMETLLQVLRAYKYDYEKGGFSFPYSVLNSYALVADDSALHKHYCCVGGFNLPPQKAVLLNLLSEWLGQEFAALKPSVNAQAEQFKLRHIESIDKLPPAKDLVSELFPQCMRTFMYNWMQTNQRCPEAGTSDAKKMCPDIHPYVQLILEFANNTLVTGVAHVLYSSLMQSQ
ncbi:hypothetical protein CAPTEDRAFT_225598 [Capitella teleta]|uniref:THAP-type domain-containing protein n=1 Tax=Capitella teleta TaxID=283909 RepID=R7UCG5_CAPTE|nr:hypothetical protein CAPTEDRAFT_225598 [Capitella teleta]|eukprot:ELU04070.1 hypothetical protein CAPTEDRAFT_225598 [Capitella teleta]